MQLKAQHFNQLAALEQWGLNTVMHQGKVLTEGSMDRVKHDPKVVEVYLGH